MGSIEDSLYDAYCERHKKDKERMNELSDEIIKKGKFLKDENYFYEVDEIGESSIICSMFNKDELTIEWHCISADNFIKLISITEKEYIQDCIEFIPKYIKKNNFTPNANTFNLLIKKMKIRW